MASDRPVTITLDDPELAFIFERLAYAIQKARPDSIGLAPKDLLRLYIELLNEGADVSLTTVHLPVSDPEAG